jgi:hypothetical protein
MPAFLPRLKLFFLPVNKFSRNGFEKDFAMVGQFYEPRTLTVEAHLDPYVPLFYDLLFPFIS